VTYGTASAPYLATHCLQQLAADESKDFSLAPETLTDTFYVDDALCGANTIEDALQLQQELIALLRREGFHLRKFCASHPSILEAVPPDCREMEVPIELDSNEGIKTLGLLWHPLLDKFLIRKGTCAQKLLEPNTSPVSKGIVSSIIAAIFDPLSLISPVVIYRIFLQQLWLHKLEWDDQLPSELLKQWIDMYLCLSQVNECPCKPTVQRFEPKIVYIMHPFTIYALTACQPQKEGERARERESYLFPSQLLRELQTVSDSQALKLTTKLI
jgi:hypothetical protein